jgi:hypothetical protein
MSAETKDEAEVYVGDAADVEDDFVSNFQALESSPDLQTKIADFEALLQNPRYDEKAVKVKEQCIYR